MNSVPTNLKYTAEHEWVEIISAEIVRIGITDFAQHALGDIVFVLPPKIGEAVRAGAVCGEVESTKSVSEIYAPVTGKVSAINEAVISNPERINNSPYSEGWLFEVSSVGAAEIEALLDSASYTSLTESSK
jgi:glycine cleavage system H protein